MKRLPIATRPGRSPIGARFQFGRLNSKGYWYTIVGIVKEIRERGVAERSGAGGVSRARTGGPDQDQPSGIVVRTSVDPESIVTAVRQAIWSIDKNEPVARLQTVEQIVGRQLSAPSQNTAPLGAFALLALVRVDRTVRSALLCGHATHQRNRRAQDAGRDLQRHLLTFSRRGVASTLNGLAIGVVLAVIAARLMTTLFYGFQPDYLPAVALVSVILLSVAALACFVPARRASRIDPMIALAHE